MRATCTPGLNLALACEDRIVWQQGFGYADIRAAKPMTVDATFPGGSIGKLYTTIAVMQLVEKGLIGLYEPVASYLPELSLNNPLGERPITTYDLLTYRSGLSLDLADQTTMREPLGDYLHRALADGRRREYQSAAPRWVAKVGTEFHYSSLGIAILGYLVQRVNPTGLSFADYVAHHILQPLGAVGTGFRPDGTSAPDVELDERRCTGYARFGGTVLPSPHLRPLATPAGSLLTTPADSVLLLICLMNEGRTRTATLIEPATASLILTPQVEDEEAGMSEAGLWKGLCCEMTRLGQTDFNFGHGGAQPWGWWSLAAAFPHYRTAIAAFGNRWDMPRWFNPTLENAPGLVVEFVRRWLNGEPAARRHDIAEHSWDWLISWTIGFAIAERTVALLGAHRAFADSDIAQLASEATTPDGNIPAGWDPGAFACGARAMIDLPPTADAVANYLSSGDAPVTTADLPLLALAFGQRTHLGLPHPFFAQASVLSRQH
jgi:CubicO group peptidase (beta-lactamase class C family)